jgi:hypothetical protein
MFRPYDEYPPVVGFLIWALVGFLGYELIVHAKEILFGGVVPCISAFWQGMSLFWSLVAGSIGGAAASTLLLSCIAIPIVTVAMYAFFQKVDEKPKALIMAIGLFLDPLFIDFFKDKIDGPIRKLLVASVGVVTFLVASSLWNKVSSRSELNVMRKRKARAIAFILFLLPTLGMVGYVAMYAYRDSKTFFENLTMANVIGLVGLLITAFVGISLSRFYEVP